MFGRLALCSLARLALYAGLGRLVLCAGLVGLALCAGLGKLVLWASAGLLALALCAGLGRLILCTELSGLSCVEGCQASLMCMAGRLALCAGLEGKLSWSCSGTACTGKSISDPHLNSDSEKTGLINV